MNEIYGIDIGYCAWCPVSDKAKKATKSYVGEMAGGIPAIYYVCNTHFLEFAPDKDITIWDKERR